MAESLPIHPLTVDDLHAMAEAGILTEDDRVELIDGQLIQKMTIGPKHLRIVNFLTEIAVRRASDVAEVSIQNPVRLGRYTEPEPDIALLRRDRDPERIPHAEDVLLLVEVADTTLQFDRNVKLPRYAAAGVPEVWIVNIPDRQIECHTDPSPSGYNTLRTIDLEGAVEASLIPQLGSISARAILDG